MSYYKEKRQSLALIETMIKNNSGKIEPEMLYYEIYKKYGFSETMVEKMLGLLENTGKIERNMGVFEWKSTKN